MAEQQVLIPDLGGVDEVTVIEIFVAVGDSVQKEQSLLTLESEKASMEIPAPYSGIVKSLQVKVGDKVKEGQAILRLKTAEVSAEKKTATKKEKTQKSAKKSQPETKTPVLQPVQETTAEVSKKSIEPVFQSTTTEVHAGPAVRQLARELGADLGKVAGTGPKNRILKEDLTQFVKQSLLQKSTTGLPEIPEVDFTKFGDIETKTLSRIKAITATNMHRNWVNIPHVTQLDEADITELEQFRKDELDVAKQKGVKLTLLAFIVKAIVAALKEFPQFNASLNKDRQSITLKKYFHIGIAVDTAEGLVVPVIRHADHQSLLEIAQNIMELSQKARDKRITPAEMQGGCFTISSLGPLGGAGFTPIINAPEVAILGVSKSTTKPIYNANNSLVPRLMLPLALSYDHRVIDGVEGGKFLNFVAQLLSDVRRLIL